MEYLVKPYHLNNLSLKTIKHNRNLNTWLLTSIPLSPSAIDLQAHIYLVKKSNDYQKIGLKNIQMGNFCNFASKSKFITHFATDNIKPLTYRQNLKVSKK